MFAVRAPSDAELARLRGAVGPQQQPRVVVQQDQRPHVSQPERPLGDHDRLAEMTLRRAHVPRVALHRREGLAQRLGPPVRQALAHAVEALLAALEPDGSPERIADAIIAARRDGETLLAQMQAVREMKAGKR